MLTGIGVALALLALAVMAWLTWRSPAASAWPAHGTWAIAALAALEAMLALHVAWVAAFFSALAWTAYIAAVDAAVFRLRGDSLLRHGKYATALALLSIPAWLVFEAYNLRLRNWIYTGVPAAPWQFLFGAGWAFATIFPGIFETADLFYSAGMHRMRTAPRAPSAVLDAAMIAAGALMLALPFLVPARQTPFWFAPVWVGVFLLLDPVNRHRGLASIAGDWQAGRMGRFWSLLAAGGVCGILWEFWNYWAAARWWYVFPILPHWRVFAMPVPGFLGFPPFALECFVLAVAMSEALLPKSWRRAGILAET